MWIASLVVYLWAKRYFGEPVAAIAVLFFTFLPPILAHAGLATTDMALTAFTGASFLTALIWLDEPTLLHSAVFGACTGLAVLSKFSALPFIPVSMAAALIWYFAVERPRFSRPLAAGKRALQLCLAVLIGLLVIWAGYRFSFGKVSFAALRLPAPDLYTGIQQVLDHTSKGHPAYLLGGRSDFGWWYYYPIVLAVKTPLPFLALLLFGTRICVRKHGNRGSLLSVIRKRSFLSFLPGDRDGGDIVRAGVAASLVFFLFFAVSRESDEVIVHGKLARAYFSKPATRAHSAVAVYYIGQTFSCYQFR